ncbi:hypothetical protein FHS62_002193 [Amphiplicatus metriothermophilus]|nr:hypothetical protein [Amphiplicatus metriothermophilus]
MQHPGEATVIPHGATFVAVIDLASLHFHDTY